MLLIYGYSPLGSACHCAGLLCCSANAKPGFPEPLKQDWLYAQRGPLEVNLNEILCEQISSSALTLLRGSQSLSHYKLLLLWKRGCFHLKCFTVNSHLVETVCVLYTVYFLLSLTSFLSLHFWFPPPNHSMSSNCLFSPVLPFQLLAFPPKHQI